MRTGIILLALSVMMLSFSPVCAANAYMDKFTAGLTNLLTGWMELGKQPMDTYNETNNVAEATIVGVLKGAIFAVGRTAAGAIDTVFFFLDPDAGPLMEPMFDVLKSDNATATTTK